MRQMVKTGTMEGFVDQRSCSGNKPEADVLPGLEGEYVNIRESSAQMSVKRMASLIEYTTAWAIGQGVRFTDRRYE